MSTPEQRAAEAALLEAVSREWHRRMRDLLFFAALAGAWLGLLAVLAANGASGWVLTPAGAALAVLALLCRRLSALSVPGSGRELQMAMVPWIQAIHALFIVAGIYFAAVPFLRGKVPGLVDEPARTTIFTGARRAATPYPRATPAVRRATAATPANARVVIYPPGVTPAPARPVTGPGGAPLPVSNGAESVAPAVPAPAVVAPSVPAGAPAPAAGGTAPAPSAPR